ncbi:MAG TPA: hypothetical protein VNY73_10770, partial [Bacteroidia bacterium]|nr:hypothetical protein [Bacteroidia bacterium]
MKRSLLTILTVITWQLAMAQTNPIPNYDFENWTGTTLNNWYASSVAGCTKSTTAHSGSFALRMTPWNSSSYGANAYTPSSGQAFQLGGLYPTALTGWYMANFASGDQLQIDVSVYSGGGGTGTGVAFINTSASAYTQFTV